MIINKQGKVIANVAQPTVKFSTKELYEAWVVTLPSPAAEANFNVIKEYEVAKNSVKLVDDLAALNALTDEEKDPSVLYVTRDNNMVYTFNEDEAEFTPSAAAVIKTIATKAELDTLGDEYKTASTLVICVEDERLYRYDETEAKFVFIGDGDTCRIAIVAAYTDLPAAADADAETLYFVKGTGETFYQVEVGDEKALRRTNNFMKMPVMAYASATDFPEVTDDMTLQLCIDLSDGKLHQVAGGEWRATDLASSELEGTVYATEYAKLPKNPVIGILYSVANGTVYAVNPSTDWAEEPSLDNPRYVAVATDISEFESRVHALEEVADDVKVYANKEAFPAIGGETGPSEDVLYVALDTGLTYVWKKDDVDYTQVGGQVISDAIPELTTQEWKDLEEKPDYAVITDSIFDGFAYTIE